MIHYFLVSKLVVIKLPVTDPLIKLKPKMKPIGKSTVLSINKFTLPLFELFCVPIINNKNKQELKVTITINLLKK